MAGQAALEGLSERNAKERESAGTKSTGMHVPHRSVSAPQPWLWEGISSEHKHGFVPAAGGVLHALCAEGEAEKRRVTRVPSCPSAKGEVQHSENQPQTTNCLELGGRGG